MAGKPSLFRQSDIERAIKALTNQGLTVTAVIIEADKVMILCGDHADNGKPVRYVREVPTL